jgi:hypothetical protein
MLICERLASEGDVKRRESEIPNDCDMIPKTGRTNQTDASPISAIKPIMMNCGQIIPLNFKCSGSFLAGSPRNTIPKALVKQKIARPPIRERPTMVPRIRMDWSKLAADRLLNIPE